MFKKCIYLFKSTLDKSIFCKIRTHAICRYECVCQLSSALCSGDDIDLLWGKYWPNDKDEVVLHQFSQEIGQISPLEELCRCCLSFAEKENVGRMYYADGNVQLYVDEYVLQVGYQ